MKRKPYSELSNKQQNRRRKQLCGGPLNINDVSQADSCHLMDRTNPDSPNPATSMAGKSTDCADESSSHALPATSSATNVRDSSAFTGNPCVDTLGEPSTIVESDVQRPTYWQDDTGYSDFDGDSVDPESSEVNGVLISNEEKIEAAISNWSAECPLVPQSSISKLLSHLKVFFPEMHTTAKTVIEQVSLDTTVTKMHFGRYVHFNNWEICLKKHIETMDSSLLEISLNCNVDGIPLFNDSRMFHAYPILLQLCPLPEKIICAGVYLSEEVSNKMPDINIFFQKFVSDLSVVCERGLEVNGRKISVKLNAFICDAPARAHLKNIVGHTSYNSCERCIEKGSYAGGHVALLSVDAPLRTDEGFASKSDPNHHKSGQSSIIETLEIGPVTGVVLDYMHLACLGIVKRLLNRMKKSKRYETQAHISVQDRLVVENSLKIVSKHLPSNFSRKLNGGLNALAFWKATEFRVFLLYVGIIVLRDVLPVAQYNNFLYLSISFRILLSCNQAANIENVRKLLINFVESSKSIYGDGFVSYNVHSVIHLPDDYVRYDSLNNISCFPFESYLGSIVKGRLSGRNNVLEQMTRHIGRENSRLVSIKSAEIEVSHNKILKGGNFIKCGANPGRDNCVMLESGNIGLVKKISAHSLTLLMFRDKSSLFLNPVDSKVVGIYRVSGLGDEIVGSEDMIHSKVLVVPVKDSYVAIKLLHRF